MSAACQPGMPQAVLATTEGEGYTLKDRTVNGTFASVASARRRATALLLEDSPVNGTSATVFRLMSDS